MPEARWLLIMRDDTDEETAVSTFVIVLHDLDEPGEGTPVRIYTVDQLLDILLASWYRRVDALNQLRPPGGPHGGLPG